VKKNDRKKTKKMIFRLSSLPFRKDVNFTDLALQLQARHTHSSNKNETKNQKT
jgi:hypothetical protein